MEWTTLYPADKQPSAAEISQFIANPLWEDLNRFLCDSYVVQPGYSYSICSGQPGWNVKYKKAGRALCTLYPMPGFFIALVTIGAKERAETELALPILSEYTQELFGRSGELMGAKWMMIQVTDGHILNDVKNLIQIRRKIKL